MRSLFLLFILSLNLHLVFGDEDTPKKSSSLRKLVSSYLSRPKAAIRESCADFPSSIRIESSVSLDVLKRNFQVEGLKGYAKNFSSFYNRNINLCDVMRGRIADSSLTETKNHKADNLFLRTKKKDGTTTEAYSSNFEIKFICCDTEVCRTDLELANDNSHSTITCAMPTEDFASLVLDESDEALETNPRRTLRSLSTSFTDCDYCPRKSHCFKSEEYIQGWHTRDGSYFSCECKEGYTGDGWRCAAINECEGEWPCAPIEEGGFCVDRDPDAEEFPRYKCSCRPGFEAFFSDEHGAKVCIPEGTKSIYIDNPSTSPTTTPVPSVSAAPSPSPSISGGCSLCPTQSLCIETSPGVKDSFLSDQDDGKYIRCKCKEGYSGDGWRCTDINECALENPPCPSEEEGGYCVDTDPEDSRFPQYECGCIEGFETSSYNKHGATSCRTLTPSPTLSFTPTVSFAPSIAASQVPTSSFQPTTSFSPTELELTDIVDTVFFNVNGTNVQGILSEKDLLELTFIETYQELDPNECNCRFLTNVTLLGVLSEAGFQSATDEFESTIARRMLQPVSNGTNSTNSTNSSNSTTTFLVFDFSIWFRYVFSCFNCASSFLVNDASRRKLLSLTNFDFKIPASTFATTFQDNLIENDVESVVTVVSTVIEPPVQFEASLPKTAGPTLAPTVYVPCSDCNGANKECIGGECQCKTGYQSISGVGGVCSLIPYCEFAHLNDCNLKEICVSKNPLPGYKCKCKDNFEYNDVEKECVDRDECLDPTICSGDTICINTFGSYNCVDPTPAPTPKPTPRAISADELVPCVAVIDEDDDFVASPNQTESWADFRRLYPLRPFCLVAVKLYGGGDGMDGPTNFQSDPLAREIVGERDPVVTDWFGLCGIPATVNTVALWIDGSGSLIPDDVGDSFDQFQIDLNNNNIFLDYQEGSPYDTEDWITPFKQSFPR